MESDDLACPRCGHVDQAHKLSAVVRAGTTVGGYAGTTAHEGYMMGEHGGPITMGGHAMLSGGSQTLLSRRLAPPSRPSYDKHWVIEAAKVVGGALVFGLIAYSFGWHIIGDLLFLAGVYGVWSEYRQDKLKWAAQQRAMTEWTQQIAVWDRMYYCGRDDVVYLPGMDEVARADHLQRFLQLHAHQV